MSKIYEINTLRNILYPVFSANPVYSAIIFGSYAKGNASDKSDIDIVIDSHGQLLNITFYGLLDEIIDLLGIQVDLFELSEIHKPSPLYTEIIQYGVNIYDRQG